MVKELLDKGYNLNELLTSIGMARSTFYYNLTDKKDKYELIRKQIYTIFHHHKARYGYRRITAELRNQGYLVNHKTVEKLMQEASLRCKVRAKKYNSYRKRTSSSSVPNILNRDFTSFEPYKKWVTDVTEFSLFGQKRYLSTVMDLYNGEIMSYTLYKHPTASMVTTMLTKALLRVKQTNRLIIHSDQGWHYKHYTYTNILAENNITQSMSRKATCLDNASMENFFGILKTELLYLQKFKSIEHFERELKMYIEYYNNDRIKLKLNAMSPVKYRAQNYKNTDY